MTWEPGYKALLQNGELEKRVDAAWKRLEECDLCPHRCKVNRLEDEKGFCGIGKEARIASYGPHFGEEAPLVGKGGSGTVFFAGCNLRCVYCQNYEISHSDKGIPASAEFLAFCFLALQEEGCHNINLVTPSHVVPFFLKGLLLAAREGLSLPIVYNTSGYDSLSTLSLLDGIIDIYMPDFKYWDEEIARRLSNIKNYPEVARKAVKEMHRQTGDLSISEDGIAKRGLLIRHLVLPGGLSGTKDVMEFIANEISPNTYVNIMNQYHPCGTAWEFSELARKTTPEEYKRALLDAENAGLTRIDRSC